MSSMTLQLARRLLQQNLCQPVRLSTSMTHQKSVATRAALSNPNEIFWCPNSNKVLFFSSSTADDNDDKITTTTSSDEAEMLTGTVKFYLRNKAYGFVIADDPERIPGNEQGEVWVHRTSIETPHSAQEFPTRPYLVKGERVKFLLEESPAGGSHGSGNAAKAVGLIFENGRQIPLFRKNYHASVVKGEQTRLGAHVMAILQNESLSETEQMEKIQQVYEAAKDTISQAAAKQEEFGPELD